MQIISFLVLLSSIPLFLIFLDYNKKENIHKSIIFVVSFIVLAVIISLMIRHESFIYLTIAIPFLLLFLVLKK